MRIKPLKFLGEIMRKKGLESLTLTEHTEGKRGRGKQWATYLNRRQNYRVGDLEKSKNVPKGHNGQEALESYDHSHPKGTWHTEEGNANPNIYW